MEFCSRYTGRVSRMDKLYRIEPHNLVRWRQRFIKSQNTILLIKSVYSPVLKTDKPKTDTIHWTFWIGHLMIEGSRIASTQKTPMVDIIKMSYLSHQHPYFVTNIKISCPTFVTKTTLPSTWLWSLESTPSDDKIWKTIKRPSKSMSNLNSMMRKVSIGANRIAF